MPMIACKDCGAQISQSAKACPKCGCPVDHGMGISLKVLTVFFGLLAAFMGYMFYVSSQPGYQAKRKAREQYKICMKLAHGVPYLQHACGDRP